MGFYQAILSTDGSGDGTGNWGNWQPEGWVEGISVELLSGLSTVDVAVTEPNGLKRTLLDVADITADAAYSPQQEIQDNAGAGTGSYKPFYINLNNLAITLANGTVSQTEKCIVTISIIETRD
jgi:hypothetical protein